MHQNRPKRNKREVNYFELNIGKGRPQPKSKNKSKTKRLDIVAALREPSETRLAAYQIQKKRQHSNPGDVIGTIIKTEIKSEIKIESEQINTRHRYKNTLFLMSTNYIHADGTPCKSARRKADELPDLPSIEDMPQTRNATGLAVETSNCTPMNKTYKYRANEEANRFNKPITNDELPGEAEHQNDITTVTPTDKTISTTVDKMNQNTGLTVEMTTDNTPVYKTKENDELPMTKQLNNMPNEMIRDNEKNSEQRTVSEAVIGLIMLQEDTPTDDPLLQKYDNSSLMPVGATSQTDYRRKPISKASDNDNDTDNDSDDTIILQQKLEETIGESLDNRNANILTPETPAETVHDNRLPVETTENKETLDKSSGLPVETTNKSEILNTSTKSKDPSKLVDTPASPKIGKVVFKSYRL